MPSIRDFSGGVVNQELLGKDGGAGIMIDANNVLSSWNGELRKRTGSRIIAQLEKKSRIIPYRLPNNDDALLVFSDGNVKGYSVEKDGFIPLQIEESAGKVDFPTKEQWTSNSVNGWAVSTNIESPNSAYQMFGKDTFSANKQSAGKYIQINNDSPVRLLNINVVFYSDTYGVYNGFSDPYLMYSDDNIVWHVGASSFTKKETTNKPTIGAGYSFMQITINNADSSGSAHKFWRVVYATSVGTGGFRVDIPNGAVSFISSSVEFFDKPTVYSEEDLNNIRFAQAGENLYVVCKGKTPYKLINSSGALTFSEFNPTISETLRLWDSEGYPCCVAAFQNRLAFGGFEKHKNRVLMSEFGNFENYKVKSTDVKSTAPILADSVEIRSLIENLWSGNSVLYALSADGVAMLDAQGGVVATDQINFKLRNREPADGMTPTVKDDIMIYLGNDRRKIFITDYDFAVQRFKAKDLSIGYNNFFASRVVALHYATRKCSLIYGYKDDVNLLALLFDVDLNKNSLFPCDTAGATKDMAVLKTGDFFRFFFVSQMGNGWFLIEKNEQPEYNVMDFMSEENKREYSKTVVQDGLYLDYMTRRYYSEPVSVITNVPYAVGTKVAVFADGNYIGEKDCTADGIVLDTPASDFVLGYNYDAYAVLKLATPYTSKKYPKEVATYLINTGYLEIGNSFDNLQPILNNMRDKLDLFDKPMLLNGEYTKTMDKLDNSPYIILRSNEPMPFMITGIDFKVDYSNYQGGI